MVITYSLQAVSIHSFGLLVTKSLRSYKRARYFLQSFDHHLVPPAAAAMCRGVRHVVQIVVARETRVVHFIFAHVQVRRSTVILVIFALRHGHTYVLYFGAGGGLRCWRSVYKDRFCVGNRESQTRNNTLYQQLPCAHRSEYTRVIGSQSTPASVVFCL